jgi:hypothetical protein
MSGTKGSTLETTGTVETYCIQCGKVIDGKPYEMSMDGVCASVTPVYWNAGRGVTSITLRIGSGRCSAHFLDLSTWY